MFKKDYKSPQIEAASHDGALQLLVADVPADYQLYQGQQLLVKTGVAIRSDQYVFAVPLTELNHMGLVLGTGIELLETGQDSGEIEVLLYNRNNPGQQRMIPITPLMPIAQLVVMPAYDFTGKNPAAVAEAAPKKRGPKPKTAAA